MKKTAVVLLNLGGPSSLDEVTKFLFNLFKDKAIINLPNPLRWMIAKIISSTRSSKTKNIYRRIGGKSPLLELTNLQAHALEKSLNISQAKVEFKVFVSMRYCYPLSSETVTKIKIFGADEILLLPLYPQFSTTTTKSSIDDFRKSLEGIPIKAVCCYYNDSSFIKAHLEKIKSLYKKVKNKHRKFRILFSAHGLPKSIVNKGDPYQWQIDQTVNLIMKDLDIEYKVCYQSKVGPMKWLEPNTKSEIQRASEEDYAVIIVPIAFVSEHSETLYELDIEYQELANNIGLTGYYRVKALGIDKLFIESLVKLSMKLAGLKACNKDLIVSNNINRVCPERFCGCINDYREKLRC